MDVFSDKHAKSYSKNLGHGLEKDTLRKKLNLFLYKHKKRHKDQSYQSKNW